MYLDDGWMASHDSTLRVKRTLAQLHGWAFAFKRDGWMDQWMDQWMDGSVDGWLDGWMANNELRTPPLDRTVRPKQPHDGTDESPWH